MLQLKFGKKIVNLFICCNVYKLQKLIRILDFENEQKMLLIFNRAKLNFSGYKLQYKLGNLQGPFKFLVLGFRSYGILKFVKNIFLLL